MAVTWGAAGTAASGTTSCTPAYPTGISAATSKILCAVTGRSNTADTAFTMPAGWTKIGASELEGGTGTWGVDTGTRRVTFFAKDTTVGDETGTVTVSLAGTANNTLRATIFRVEVTSGYGIQYEATTGADTTNDTGFSASGAAIGFAPGDLLAILVAQNIDTGTQSAQSITASGVTFGTRTNRASTAVTNGNDHRHILDTVPVSSGTATAAPTYAYTISAAGSGPVAFLRMREVAPPVVTSQPTDQTVLDGGDATFTLAGTGYDSVKWQELIGGGGGGAAYIEGSAQSLVGGANSITIPTGAVSAVLLNSWWHGGGSTPSWVCSALPDLNTNRVFTNGSSAPPYPSGMLRTHSEVTATGAQTLTLSGQTDIFNGPVGFVLFFDGAIEVIDGDANSVGDTGTASIVLDSETGAIILVLDSNLDTTTPPSTPGGWTQLQTVGSNSQSATLRMKVSSGSSESIGSTSPNYETLIAYAIRGGTGSTWTDVSGATATTLTLTGVTLADNGRKFRGVLTSSVGSTTTTEVTLTVTDGKLIPISFTTAPPESPTSTNMKTALAPSGVQAGDMEVICCGVGAIAPAAAPTINDTTSGWSRVAHSDGTHQIGEGVFNLRMAVFVREATGAATDAVLTSSANGYWGWHRFALRNANADFLARVIFDAASQSTLPVLPGYTPEKSNTLRIDWMALGALAAISPASGMTEWSENTDHALGLYYQQIADTDPTGTRTYGFSPASDAGTITLELHSLASDAGGGSATDLALAEANHSHTADSLTLTTSTTLVISDSVHAHLAENQVLTSSTGLTIADSSHGHVAEELTLSIGVGLSVNDTLHAHAADAATLTADSTLAIDEATHGHTAEGLTVATDSVLAVNDSSHAHAADGVTLGTTTGTNLTVADAAHAHSAEAAVLSTESTLAVADSSHQHAADAILLTTSQTLAVQEAQHGHSADNLDLSGIPTLNVADAAHAHTSDATALSTSESLEVQEAVHGHQAEVAVLSTQLSLAVDDAGHEHSAENLTLSDVPALGVQDAHHEHVADSAPLTIEAWLQVAEAFHVHRSDNVTLTAFDAEDELFPLAGQTQTFELTGQSQGFPLGGRVQTFPLG